MEGVIICNGTLYIKSFQGELRLLDKSPQTVRIKNNSINTYKNVEIKKIHSTSKGVVSIY